jgi:hypothetical protein
MGFATAGFKKCFLTRLIVAEPDAKKRNNCCHLGAGNSIRETEERKQAYYFILEA